MSITKIEPNLVNASADFTFNNVTATGNLSSLNANLGNLAQANYFSGSGANLTNLPAGNISGQVGNALISGTVYTSSQPNITSVGTLSSLSVTGNANTGNLGTTNFIATGTGSFGANVNLNSFNITNLATPNASTDAATKQYVDDVAQGLNVHDAAAAATPDTLAIITSGTITYNNGSSGVGANLTTTGTFNLIDGVNVQTSGTRILVKNEANAVHNGIYTWSNATVITRATDYNSVPEVEAGDFIFVTGGTVYDNTGWVQTSTVSAIGTPGNNIEFTQFSGAGTYQAGTGLTLTGSTFSVNASQTQVTSVGTLTSLSVNGNIIAANITANTGVFTGNGSGLSSIAGANVSGQVGNALIAGTVYTAAQPNITSVGTLTSLAVTGNITSGNANLGNNVSANFFTGNGIYLTGITTAGISNGNSNVSISTANGNITMSAVGNANIVTVTGTGANISGTLNTTGNVTFTGSNISLGNVGNVRITGGTANYVLSTDGAGNLDWVAQSGGNAANVTVDNFTGNGVQTIFTLSTTPIGINQTSVNYNGATVLRTDYTLANANITFSSAPANGSLIEVTTINLTSGGGGGGITAQDLLSPFLLMGA